MAAYGENLMATDNGAMHCPVAGAITRAAHDTPGIAEEAAPSDERNFMTHTRQTPQSPPADIHGIDEQKRTARDPRRWYQAGPGSRRSVNILGKGYPWWVAILIVLFVIA
jgi:hypothetical protein